MPDIVREILASLTLNNREATSDDLLMIIQEVDNNLKLALMVMKGLITTETAVRNLGHVIGQLPQ